MVKEKIAIAIDSNLLRIIDSKSTNSNLSRSQVMDNLLRKGLGEETITSAVILLRGDHQKYSLKKIDNDTLLSKQILFLTTFGVRSIHIVTQESKYLTDFIEEVAKLRKKYPADLFIHEKNVKGNAEAIYSIRSLLNQTFIAMSGDLNINFNLNSIVKKYFDSNKISTMGLMMEDKPIEFGNAILDGDLIINFIEKPKKTQSYAVNTGFYLFNQKVMPFLRNKKSLEKEVFPKLAKEHQLIGHFIRGEYKHMEK